MSIRLKIIFLPVSVALLVALLMGGGIFASQRKAMQIIHDRELDTAQAWLESSIHRTHKLALSQAEVIASMPIVQKAVAGRDDMALEVLFGPGFEHMKSVAGVVQMQFHLPPATSLIRIHNLARRGDDLSAFRQTVVDANTTGQSLSGLERGRAGLGARGVAVIRYGGRPVGTVEVGLDIGMSYLAGLSRNTGNNYEFYLIPDTEISTFDAADTTDYRIGATFEHPPLLSHQELQQLSTGAIVSRDIELNGAPQALRAVAIRDYAGDVAGVVSIIQPTEAYGAIGLELLTTAGIAAIAALLLGTFVGYVTGRNLARRFAEVTLTTERLARGDPSLTVLGTDRNDEIGGIFRALKMFQEKMQENVRMAQALEDEAAARRAQEASELARSAREAEARRKADEAEAERQRQQAEALARAAQAEQAAAEARLSEQQDVVERLAEGLDALARGDLTHEIDTSLPGQYETLRLDFNRAMAQLRETMKAITDTAGGIDTEVGALAQASDDLARRSERNAATLEQTAAALDELTASVRSAAHSAGEARRLTDEANRNADQGSESVGHVVEAMARIEASSRGIEKITGVIDEIAFQTNLLALNAGVEAARAGEAGRGFAVVASEVRALAQRSSEAAKEISELIRSSGNEVSQGVALVGHTGTALDRILASVHEIAEQVSAIANSSTEQAAGLAEINQAVNQLDSSTQQNAAMYEETNAATALLTGKSTELVAAVRQFVLDHPARTDHPGATAAA